MVQILVVEDQVFLADDLSALLMDAAGELQIGGVFTAYNAFEALELLQTQPIDIVITDIQMPGMSGLELIDEIVGINSQIKTILVSGYSDFEYAQRAIQSKTSNYLLKPVSDEDLLEAVDKAIRELQQEWQERNSMQRLQQSIRENLPVLKEQLLQQLLRGKRLSPEELQKRVELLGLPLVLENPHSILLIRMEEHFEQFDPDSLSLLEYALFNMAGEIFGETFHLLHGRDVHDYLVILLTCREDPGDDVVRGGVDSGQRLGYQAQAEKMATMLQHNVRLYLKGTISILHSSWIRDLSLVSGLYNQALHTFRQQIGVERELLLSSHDSGLKLSHKAQSLTQLYEPPTLLHLLEAGQWDNVRLKLKAAFDELQEHWADSHEHILETYFAVASAFSYIIHKSNRWIAEVLEGDFERLAATPQFHTIQQLQDWAYRLLDRYLLCINQEIRDTRSTIVQQVEEYIGCHLGDVSLQSIASHVHLNPSYLSKIYKTETGEGISGYIYRLRMEKAAYLLKHTNEKIYEIAQNLGYAKTSYFIKLFKDMFGVTPQEYRDQTPGSL